MLLCFISASDAQCQGLLSEAVASVVVLFCFCYFGNMLVDSFVLQNSRDHYAAHCTFLMHFSHSLLQNGQ